MSCAKGNSVVPEYPWYAEVVDGSLDQGDVLVACPAGYLPNDWDPANREQFFQVDVFDLIVLTQACDLAHVKTEYVVCCPVFSHTRIDNEYPGQSARYIANQKEKVLQGVVPGSTMIAAHDGDIQRAISVVSFRQVFSLPKSFLLLKAKERHLRLLPPYREHVSQSFARFFMRVGLPREIPSFRG